MASQLLIRNNRYGSNPSCYSYNFLYQNNFKKWWRKQLLRLDL